MEERDHTYAQPLEDAMEVAAEEVCVVEERDHTYAQQEQVRILMNNLSKCLTLVEGPNMGPNKLHI